MTPGQTVRADTEPHTSKWVFVTAVALVLVLAAVVRLNNLRALPPFVDEGGHLHCALDYVSWPLADRVRHGKLFGYMAFYPTARFASDPLLATRTLIAVIGVLTTLGVMIVTRRLAGVTAAIIAGLLWATMPYVVFYDRMALHDPLISAFVVWSMIILWAGLERQSKALAAVAGLLMGLAVLTKVTAALAIATPVLVVIAAGGWKQMRQRVGPIAAFAVFPAVATITMALGPVMGVQFGDQFIRDGSTGTLASVWESARSAPTWVSEFNSPPFTWLVGATLIGAVLAPSRYRVALGLAFLIGVIGHAVGLKLWFSRYLLPSLVPLVVLMGVVIAEWGTGAVSAIAHRFSQLRDWRPLIGATVTVVLIVGFVPPWVRSDHAFATDPTKASMPPFDQYQYLVGWPSGYGLAEVVAFLNQRAQESNGAVVLVGGFARPGAWSMPLAAALDPRLTVRSHHIFGRDQLVTAAEDGRKQPTFMLLEPPEYDVPAPLMNLVTPKPRLVFEYTRIDKGRWQVYALDPSTQVASAQ